MKRDHGQLLLEVQTALSETFAPIATIAERTGLTRKEAYKTLERLTDRGLADTTKIDKRCYYRRPTMRAGSPSERCKK